MDSLDHMKENLTHDVVNNAFDRVEPLFNLMVTQGWTDGRSGIHVIVMHGLGNGFRAERTFGELDPSKHDYEAIAGSKADETWRFRRPSDFILLSDRKPGATIYHGSVYNIRYGYAVAGSGLQAYFDKLVCQAVDANIVDKLGDPTDLGDPPKGYKIEGDFLVPA